MIGPIFLYCDSVHHDTSNACLQTLQIIANIAGHTELADYLVKNKISKGFEHMMDKAVSDEKMVNMLDSCTGQCLGYFRSSNPSLRKNAVILLSKVICKDVEMEAGEEMYSSILGGTLDLLKVKIVKFVFVSRLKKLEAYRKSWNFCPKVD